MKTIIFNKEKITFDDLEFQRLNNEGYFECRGEDKNGNLYSGIIHKSLDDYSDITDIEMICAENKRPSRTFDLST